eukprot:TRINITY_DN3780_c0_g1_i1.p2 TRINITY_DN3780_c0_g1~~TRINITY_DN3780_c0_g1_i1.p2  ORF type:complete len:100 (+),score=13.36 TRINITY_DN3780_c0_g1_i1:108-407(+)
MMMMMMMCLMSFFWGGEDSPTWMLLLVMRTVFSRTYSDVIVNVYNAPFRLDAVIMRVCCVLVKKVVLLAQFGKYPPFDCDDGKSVIVALECMVLTVQWT